MLYLNDSWIRLLAPARSPDFAGVEQEVTRSSENLFSHANDDGDGFAQNFNAIEASGPTAVHSEGIGWIGR